MFGFLTSAAESFFKWLQKRQGRTLASLAALTVVLTVCIVLGGVLAQAAIITLCVYIGTLITLHRMRKPPPQNTNVVWSFMTWPVRAFASFFFRHRLLTTIVLAILATYMIGFSTVTGIAVAAICVLTGDVLVTAFTEISDWTREISMKVQKDTEVNYARAA
jgi:uncharacterized membrane protein YphA (DoxX/SURF4 family)